MNMKQSCRALICAIEGELDGRHCTEEQAAAILDHALPSLTEALARVEAERVAARGVVADLLLEKGFTDLKLAEAVELGKALHSACVNLLYGGYDRITELGGDCDPVSKMEAENPAMQEWKAFLARHAQAEQQEAQGAQAGDERAAFESWFTEKAKTLPLLRGQSVLRYHKGEGQYVSDWALFGHMVWEARAALATQPAVQAVDKQSALPAECEWIEWGGNGTHAPFDEMLGADIRFRDGDEFSTPAVIGLRWSHTGDDRDIVAYRIHNYAVRGAEHE